jgi:hypothetical protein
VGFLLQLLGQARTSAAATTTADVGLVPSEVYSVLTGGIITAVVAWLFFRWTSKQTEARFHEATEETANMLRTFAVTLEQVGARLGIPIKFLRDPEGRIDLSRPGMVTGTGDLELPGLQGSGEGTVE